MKAVTVDTITPTGNKTPFNQDFNPIPVPTYDLTGHIGSVHFTCTNETEEAIRENFGLSYDRFHSLADPVLDDQEGN